MANVILQLLTDGVFLIVFVLTLIDVMRYRDLARFEVAALFGILAGVIVLQGLKTVLPATAPWAALLTALLFFSQPYLLVRLLDQFQRVPPGQHIIGFICLVGSWVIVLVTGPDLQAWAISILALAFVYVEGHATFAFVKAAFSTRGITHLRLLAVAIGSGLLGLIILLLGLASVLPAGQDIVAALTPLLGLSSAVSYYFGFATPVWLRRVWQRAEVHQFLLGMTGHAMQDRVATALEYLAPAAARATGGKVAFVALAEDDGASLRLHSAGLPAKMNLDPLPLGPVSPILDRAWRSQRAVVARDPNAWGAPLKGLAQAFGGARGALIAPLTAGEQAYGLVIVLVERGVLFVEDDVAILGILAEQTALAMERRRLLDVAEREGARLTAVMGSMTDGVMLLDSANRIQYSNARAAELLSADAHAVIGMSPQLAFVRKPVDVEFVPDDDGWDRAIDRAEDRPSFELHLDGSPARDVLVQTFAVAESGGAHHGVGIALRDVTTERDLARTKDELVSVVSHELRTPLASVVGFAELLLARPAMAEAQRQQYLGVMVEEGRRLTALINDFLHIQRLESGQQTINPRSTAVRPVLEQAVIAAGEDSERPVLIDIADTLPPVRADADRLRQVLGNLIGNARKYSPRGGLIRLEAGLLDGQVCISVQDQGLGLPAAALPRLFEKFYRIDNSDRREIAGTGLGLAISRRIVEGHGGRIWAESAGLGAGARFSFTLPIAPVAATTGDVLVVEDGSSFAQLLEAELGGQGFSAICVTSAEEALDQMAITPPRMIVLDLLLPGMAGEEFLAQVRATSGGGELPIVVVTVKDLSPTDHEILAGLAVHSVLRKGPGVAAEAARTVAATLNVGTARAG
jgi:signal transduction histidine kinase/CheY-like chemotaxis protein